mmetsp:Transcript_28822/g.91865  ORF Transcript_28822/g.91865 Transcript_28822/m.91865 type:complete len:271 (+) Transcript_28822:1240-2052(+)
MITACRVLPKGRRARQRPPVMNSKKVMGGGSRGSSTQAASTSSSLGMPRQRRGTLTLEVQRVSGGAMRSFSKNSSQSARSSSISKFLTPHHLEAGPSQVSAVCSRMRLPSEALCMLWAMALLKTSSMKFSARGTVNSKFAISVWKEDLDLLLMSTSMLSVAVARLNAYLAASSVKRIVPVSATRLTMVLKVARTPSSMALMKPPCAQPPQQGASFLYFVHSIASVTHETWLQKVVLTPMCFFTAQVSQWSCVHCPAMLGAEMQNCCIFAK